MHIPDNYLSPQTCAVMTAAAIPVLAVSIYKVKKELTPEKISKLGVASAFTFLGMMFNIPLPGGTTGHVKFFSEYPFSCLYGLFLLWGFLFRRSV